MQLFYLSFFLFLVASRLSIVNIDEIDIEVVQDVALGQLLEYNDPPTVFDPIVDEVLYYDLSGELGLNYTGRVVMIGNEYGQKDQEELLRCGAKVLIVGTSAETPGLLSWSAKFEVMGDETLNGLAFQYSLDVEGWKELTRAVEAGQRLVLNITDDGNENRWEIAMDSPLWVTVQVIATLFTFATAGIALEKLILKCIIKYKGLEAVSPNVSDVILFIEFLINVFRGLYFALDPIGMRGVVPNVWNFYCAVVTAPFSAMTTALLLIFVNDAVSGRESIISKYRVVVFVAFSILIVFGVFVIPIAFFFVDDGQLVVNIAAGFFTIVFLLVTIYIFYTAPRLLHFTKKLDSKKRDSVLKMVYLLIASAVATLFSVVMSIWIIFVRGELNEYLSLNYLWLISVVLISIFQILAFKPEKTICGSLSTSTRTKTAHTKSGNNSQA